MAGPVGHTVGDADGQAVPVDVGVRVAEVQVTGNDPVPHRQDRLDETRDAGGGAEMSDVRLHGTHQQGMFRVALSSVDGCRCVQLDGIADDGAGAVGLQVVDVGGGGAGPLQGLLHRLRLGRRAGHGQTLAGSVLIDRRAGNDGPDPVAVRLGVAEALEDDQAAALAGDETVGGRVKGPALARGRQHAGVGAQLERPSGELGMDAAGQNQVRLAALEPRHGLVNGDQRGRAGGVDRHRRPFQAENEGHAADRGVQGVAGGGVEPGRGLARAGIRDRHVPVVHDADAGIDAGAAALEASGVDGRVLEGPPAHFQHHPLLGIEHLRLDRRDAEELRVEQVEVLDVRPETDGLVAGGELGELPSRAPDDGAGRALHHRVLAGEELSPVAREVVAAGEAAGHADDRYRLFAGCAVRRTWLVGVRH